MLSNKLTFSLASLVMLIALGLVFAPVSVMADPDQNPAADDHPGDSAPAATHTHPTLTVTAVDVDPTMPGTQVIDKDTATAGIQFDIMITASAGTRTGLDDSDLADTTIGTTSLVTLSHSGSPLYLAVGTASFAEKQTAGTIAPAAEQFSATSRLWTRTVTITDINTDGDDINNEADEDIAPAIASGLVVSVTVNRGVIEGAGVAGPQAGQSNLESMGMFTVVAAAYVAPATPDNVEIMSTATGHGGNAILVTFTVTPGTMGMTPAALTADNIDVTNGYIIRDSFRDVTPTGANAPTDGSMTYQASVVPDPGSTMDLMVDVMGTGFVLETDTMALTVPHTVAPTTTDPTDPTLAAGEVPAYGYAVVLHTGATAADAGIASRVQVINRNLSDLYEFLRDGGTIDLIGPTTGGLKISEIMWGKDAHLGADAKNSQWIELYNTTNASIMFDSNWSFGFVQGLSTATVVDRVGNLGNPGYWQVPGKSGRTVASTEEAASELVSMYRKLKQLSDTAHADHGKDDGNPQRSGTWVASKRPSRNLAGERVGTPGAHPTAQISASPTAIDRSTVYITEIGNSSGTGVDWIELYNASDSAVNIKNWIISVVDKEAVDDATDAQLDASENGGSLDKEQVRFRRASGYDGAPDALNLPAKSYLVVVSSDPENENNPLSKGINLEKEGVDRDRNDHETGGLTHLYYVEPNLNLPSNPHLVILRNHHEKEGQPVNVRDIVTTGNFFRTVTIPNKWNTEVWPLQATPKPGDLEPAGSNFVGSTGSSYVMQKRGGVGDHNKNAWAHKDTWADAGFSGLGYDRDTHLNGTPGYDNGGVKEKVADLAGDAMISISEIMVDPGRRLPQWIEIYNSSMTQSVNLNGWKLEVYNYPSDDVINNGSINEVITLPDKKVLPNQTVLIVSTQVGRNSGRDHFPNYRLIDLYDDLDDDPFDRENRRDPILSSTGFLLVLIDKDKKIADKAGNIDDDRRRVDEPAWALPMNGDDQRSSLIRRYDDGEARDGITAAAWVLASDTELSFAHNADTYYGNPDDISTPGFRGGGPLPVSLASFRPVRDKATGEVVIRWITQSELNNAGFNILRSETKTGEFKVVNVKGIIPGHGTTSERNVYTWTDTTAKPNVVYYYQIEDVSLDGERTTLRTTHLRGNVNAAGKLTTYWGELKTYGK